MTNWFLQRLSRRAQTRQYHQKGLAELLCDHITCFALAWNQVLSFDSEPTLNLIWKATFRCDYKSLTGHINCKSFTEFIWYQCSNSLFRDLMRSLYNTNLYISCVRLDARLELISKIHLILGIFFWCTSLPHPPCDLMARQFVNEFYTALPHHQSQRYQVQS